MKELKKEKILTKEEFIYFMNKYKNNLMDYYRASDCFSADIDIIEKRSYMNPESGMDNLLQRDVNTRMLYFLRGVTADVIADLLTSEASLFGEDISWVDKLGIPPSITISYKDNNAHYPLIISISDRELFGGMEWDPEEDPKNCKEIINNFREDHFKSHVLGLKELESQRDWMCTYMTVTGHGQPEIRFKFTNDPLNNGNIKLEMTLSSYDEYDLDNFKFSDNE